MKKNTALNYYDKIREYISPNQLRAVSYKATENELKALWTFISAGYPIDFALSNYKNLDKYIKGKNLTYKEALKTFYTLYPGLIAGIQIKNPAWFELN